MFFVPCLTASQCRGDCSELSTRRLASHLCGAVNRPEEEEGVCFSCILFIERLLEFYRPVCFLEGSARVFLAEPL